jgi:hypothetical protein
MPADRLGLVRSPDVPKKPYRKAIAGFACEPLLGKRRGDTVLVLRGGTSKTCDILRSRIDPDLACRPVHEHFGSTRNQPCCTIDAANCRDSEGAGKNSGVPGLAAEFRKYGDQVRPVNLQKISWIELPRDDD